MAEVKLARQDWAGAEQIAEAIKRLGDAGAIPDEILGAALSGERKYEAGIAAFRNAMDEAPPSAVQPMSGLVHALVNAKQTDKAIVFLQSVLKKNSSNAEAYVLLGNIKLANGSAEQAESNFKAAIESQPRSNVGYQALAQLYLRLKNVGAAQDVIRMGLREDPDGADLHTALAGTLELQGDYEAAISEYEYLLKQQPGSLIIINNLASLLADHRSDKASLERAAVLASYLRDTPVAQFEDTQGWVYYRLGDLTNAVQLLEEAATDRSANPLVQYHLGMSYIGAGELAKASEQFREALALGPDSDLEVKIKAGLIRIAQ